MPALLTIGGVMIAVLLILLASIFTTSNKPYYRLIKAGDKYVIQYRRLLWLWKTYTIPNTGEPAVYYVQAEAEDMIKTLVERRKTTRSLDKLRGSTIQVFEYSENGTIMNKKNHRV